MGYFNFHKAELFATAVVLEAKLRSWSGSSFMFKLSSFKNDDSSNHREQKKVLDCNIMQEKIEMLCQVVLTNFSNFFSMTLLPYT